jgi:hypothetical protein
MAAKPEWEEEIILDFNGIHTTKQGRELIMEMLYSSIPQITEGDWKPISKVMLDDKIKIKCEYVEGVKYGKK